MRWYAPKVNPNNSSLSDENSQRNGSNGIWRIGLIRAQLRFSSRGQLLRRASGSQCECSARRTSELPQALNITQPLY
jgi:hypothetical protein